MECPNHDDWEEKRTGSKNDIYIDTDLKLCEIDIATLAKTKVTKFGSLKEQNHTFYWYENRARESRQHG